MRSGFRKISRVRSLTGGTRWYLSDDCLLAAKRMMYTVEYRRFYLRDLEYIVVWPSRSWLLRMIIPGTLCALGASLWRWVDSTAGEISIGIGLVWVLLELALGPTAGSRIRITGASIDLPLVARARRAGKVLVLIDAAVRASREVSMETTGSVATLQPTGTSVQTGSATGSAAPSIADASQTYGL